jgi:hypothetical protein
VQALAEDPRRCRPEPEQRLVYDAGAHSSRLHVQLGKRGQGADVADPSERARRGLTHAAAAIREPLDQHRDGFLCPRDAQHSDGERTTPGRPTPGGAEQHLDRADLSQPRERRVALLR